MTPSPLGLLRARIADALLGAAGLRAPTPSALGALRLHPHQRDACDRLLAMLAHEGGALLADDVGLGKTYVALAAASRYPSAVVVAPAALRTMWRGAMRRARLTLPFLTHERLSRAGVDVPGDGGRAPALVIVDEAHHARTPGTRRYAALSALTADAHVLLLSATPLHRSLDDLRALVALWRGTAAYAMDGSALARRIVRRRATDVAGAAAPPPVRATEWIDLPAEEGAVERLLDLPPAVPPRDGGDAHALLRYVLVHRWMSSDAALRATLRGRLARGWALLDALAGGVYPDRAELAAWSGGEDGVQLALAPLLASPSAPASGEHAWSPASLRAAAESHVEAIGALLARLDASRDEHGVTMRDRARARALVALRSRHPDRPVVCFTQFAETVQAFWRALRAEPGVCALTAGGARVAGGRIARDDALARFAPRACGALPPRAHERISLLLATDLLSEGVNLQDASVVVHLDLPWTAARLAQRVGRVARAGSLAADVHVHAFRPPAAGERLVGVERRLRARSVLHDGMLGVSGVPLAGASPATAPAASGDSVRRARSATGTFEWIRLTARRWRDPSIALDGDAPCAVVSCDVDGWIATAGHGVGGPLVASLGDTRTGDDADTLAAALRAIEDARDETVRAVTDREDDERRLRRAREELRAWVADRLAAGGSEEEAVARARRRLLATVEEAVRSAPAHRRPVIAALAAQARATAVSPAGAGAERALGALASSAPDGRGSVEWLERVAAAARPAPPGHGGEPRVLALLMRRGA